MTKKQFATYQMCVRVRDFGTENEGALPADSVAGRAFALIGREVARVEAHAAEQRRAIGEGQPAVKAARRDVVRRLDAITHTARGVAESTPGFDTLFQLARPENDKVALVAADAFIKAASGVIAPFVARGMPPTFVDDLRTAADQLRQAIAARSNGLNNRLAAGRGIAASLAAAKSALRELDPAIRNHFAHEPETVNRWSDLRTVPAITRHRAANGEAVPAADSRTDGSIPEEGVMKKAS